MVFLIPKVAEEDAFIADYFLGFFLTSCMSKDRFKILEIPDFCSKMIQWKDSE